MRSLSRSILVVVLLLAGASLHGQSRVRAVHLLQGAPSITFYIDSATVATESLQFGGASAAVSVSPGMHRLTITGAGAPFEFAVVDTNVMLAGDSIYSLVLAGSFSLSITRAFIVSAPAQPVTDSISTDLRFANIALGLDDVNIEATPGGGSPPVGVTALGYGGASEFVRVRAGDLTIRLSIGLQNPFYRGRGYPSGGGATTVFLAGRYDGGIDQFSVVSMADNDTGEQIPLPSFAVLPNEEGDFRAVHVASGLGTLDVIRDGVPSDSVPVGFRFATRLRVDLLGPVRFAVARTGEGSAAMLTSIDVQIVPDSSTTLFLLPGDGTSQEPTPVVLRRRQSMVHVPGESSLRLLHASPDIGAIDVAVTRADTGLFDVQGLAFKGSTGFHTIASGEFALSFTTSAGYRFVGGYSGDAILTAIISGRASDSSIAVNLLVESNPSEQEPMIFLAKSVTGSAGDAPGLTMTTTTILPNPARGHALLAFHVNRGDDVSMKIFDTNGELVCARPAVWIDAGDVRLPLPLTGLPNGVYAVLVTGSDGLPLANGSFVVLQ